MYIVTTIFEATKTQKIFITHEDICESNNIERFLYEMEGFTGSFEIRHKKVDNVIQVDLIDYSDYSVICTYKFEEAEILFDCCDRYDVRV